MLVGKAVDNLIKNNSYSYKQEEEINILNKEVFKIGLKKLLDNFNFTFLDKEERTNYYKLIYEILIDLEVNNLMFINGIKNILKTYNREDFITRPSARDIYEKGKMDEMKFYISISNKDDNLLDDSNINNSKYMKELSKRELESYKKEEQKFYLLNNMENNIKKLDK